MEKSADFGNGREKIIIPIQILIRSGTEVVQEECRRIKEELTSQSVEISKIIVKK